MKVWRHLLFSRRWQVALAAAAALLMGFVCLLPDPLFSAPYSPVLLARDGELLGARLAADRQWRFPLSAPVPERFATALIAFEDRRFYQHAGVDPLALLRAVKSQLSDSATKSGGSTLTMQVVRLSRQNPPRTIGEKLHEIVLALRLEWSYDKSDILALYAQHAPFGGNLVGLETAAWRYFGRAPNELSWAEAATLAVLPNSPALIHPGRSRMQLQQKRDRLLQRLHADGVLTAIDLRLALAEPLPDAPQPLPRWAPALLDTLVAAPAQLNTVAPTVPLFRSTLDADLQRRLTEVISRESRVLREQGIGNAAALVVDNRSGAVLAYLGNSLPSATDLPGHALDLLQRPRSSGSVLKPLLYALMLQHGQLTPRQLIPDVPTQINGYVPENFDRQYRGAVPAQEALALSLNIPAVRLLREYGVAAFHDSLQRLGLRTLFRHPDDYGLTLILGGAEITAWDIGTVYANLAATAQQPVERAAALQRRRLQVLVDASADRAVIAAGTPTAVPSRNSATDLAADPATTAGTTPRGATQTTAETMRAANAEARAEFGPGAAWLTLEAMREVNRPGAELYWRNFSSSRPLAWKTGTSFGLRDAWAIGSTPQHTIAVWAGNASGEGVPGLSGGQSAAPLLFALLQQLPDSGWFAEPGSDLKLIELCADDGLLPQQDCQRVHQRLPIAAAFSKPSPYHRRIMLDHQRGQRVHAGCANVSEMTAHSWFVLPAAIEHFYRRGHPDYRSLPPWRADCATAVADQDEQAIGLLYPQDGARVLIPVDLDGERSQVIFEAVHRRPDAVLYWHLDDDYLGSTRQFHQWALRATAGAHRLTLVDDQGQRLTRRFTVIGRR